MPIAHVGTTTIVRLSNTDEALFDRMLTLFGTVFDEQDTYGGARPGRAYVGQLLQDETFVALVAIRDDVVIGALVAYELRKFEQERSEYYIYDLAVDEGYRREGIATALIESLQTIAASRGAWVVFVQADHGDTPAIALYTKLGVREDVLHFDIPVPAKD